MEDLKYRPNVSNFTDIKVDTFMYIRFSKYRRLGRTDRDTHTPNTGPKALVKDNSWKSARDLRRGTELSDFSTRTGGAALSRIEVLADTIVLLLSSPPTQQAGAIVPLLSPRPP